MESMVTSVEVFVGEYAAGKSELAVNRALMLLSQGEKVTLVDLDLVEPTFTLRPLQAQLRRKGLEVVAWETQETFGLGEAGMVLHPAAKGVLARSGCIVLDVGYGVYGSEILRLLPGILQHPRLAVYLVVNIMRPLTSSEALIVQEAQGFCPLHALINNSHLGDETTAELVQQGALVVQAAAEQLQLPVLATAALAPVAVQIGARDVCGNPVWPLQRYLPHAFW